MVMCIVCPCDVMMMCSVRACYDKKRSFKVHVVICPSFDHQLRKQTRKHINNNTTTTTNQQRQQQTEHNN